MATKDLFLIGGMALAVYLISKQTQQAESNLPLPNLLNSPPAVVITPTPTPKEKQMIVDLTPAGKVAKTATRNELNTIDIRAKADPTKTIYYPEQGIVTAGGLGYSTANPSAYLKKASTMKIINDQTYSTPDGRSGF